MKEEGWDCHLKEKRSLQTETRQTQKVLERTWQEILLSLGVYLKGLPCYVFLYGLLKLRSKWLLRWSKITRWSEPKGVKNANVSWYFILQPLSITWRRSSLTEELRRLRLDWCRKWQHWEAAGQNVVFNHYGLKRILSRGIIQDC